MNDILDLWSELPSESIVTPPIAILHQQAELLGQKSGGRLMGSVLQMRSKNGSPIIHFEVVAPYLGDYSFRVLTVVHPVTLYPALVADKVNGGEKDCENESEFAERLGHILGSEQVRRIIDSLVAHPATQQP